MDLALAGKVLAFRSEEAHDSNSFAAFCLPPSSLTNRSLSYQLQSSPKSLKMAANTKYQPAPQRDSFDEPSYSQAPPSYQAEASDPMLGAPRGEDDNVPDDFKVRELDHITSIL